MDALQQEASKLRKDANLQDSIDDVERIIEQLERAREAIVAGMCISFRVLGMMDGPQTTPRTRNYQQHFV